MAGLLDKNKTTVKEPAHTAPMVQPKDVEPVEEKTYDYATPHSDGLTFHFNDGTSVKTENGVMKLNQTQHNEIQGLLKKGRPDIAQNMVLVDRDAAEKAARAYLEAQALKRQGHAGASSTASRHQLAELQGADKPRNLDVEEFDVSHGGLSSPEEDKIS